MVDLPSSAGIGRGQPLLRSLHWSVAVVLVGGVIAAFTTPTASGSTVLKQGLGLAVPADHVGPGSSVDQAGVAGVAGPVAPAAAPVAAPATSGAAAPAAAPPTQAKAAGTTAATKGKTAPAAGTPAAGKAAATKLQPDAGTYPMTISGSSSGGAVPSSGSLVIEQRGGDQQHRTVGVPGGLVLVQRANTAGVDLMSFSLSAGSKVLSFRPASPLPFVRTEPGASWSWSVRSTDGQVSLNQTATVSGGGSVTVGSTTVPTVTVQRVFTVSGAVQGTVRLTSTVSTVDRLPVRQHLAINVKAVVLGLPAGSVVSDTTATLTSTTPR